MDNINKNEKIKHFGVWIKSTASICINRDNYAVVDKNSSTWSPRIGKLRRSYYQTVAERMVDYDDDECRVYSDKWCVEHRRKCLLNFDLNMAYFDNLQHEAFEEVLVKLCDSNKAIKEIDNLNSYKGVSGVYVMVLDRYKQVYIGQSVDIKRRILRHWNTRKQFDRLLFGCVEESVISIDSFGALDTTRIFVLETGKLNSIEKKIVNDIPDIYRLNRIGGGRAENGIDIVDILKSTNHRQLTGK